MAIVTARTFTLDDLVIEFQDTMERENRSFCPIVKKLRAMIAENAVETDPAKVQTVEDFERWIFAQPYAVEYVLDVIRTAGTHHPPDLAANFQTAYAWQLTQYPWERVRPGLEKLLYGEVVQGIAPEAMKILAGIVRANHPNAKNFLSHPFILARIPPDVDMTDWPCADFQHLKDHCVRGQRKHGHEAAQEKVWSQLTGQGKDEDI